MTDLLSRNGWRVCFLLAGGAILAGGPLHPDGTMADMLADPNWLPFPLIVLVGLWMILAACWPARAAVYQPKAASTHA
jgi:hypothetical protein